jgi:hypothetical protein
MQSAQADFVKFQPRFQPPLEGRAQALAAARRCRGMQSAQADFVPLLPRFQPPSTGLEVMRVDNVDTRC